MDSAALRVAEMTKNNNQVVIYLGDYHFANTAEEAFLSKLRRDLGARGIPAVILANFHAPGNGQRQIDHLIFTPWRVAHIELKSLDPRYPVRGGLNGPWEISLPDGTVRLIDRKPHRQGQDGTFAMSDTVRTLRQARQLPPGRDFFKHIDTVICLDPQIPAGSNLERDKYVTAVGYNDLLERLATPGPKPDWEPQHVEALVTRLGLSRQEATSPAERQRRADAALISEYRRLFIERHSADLPPLVALSATEFGNTFALEHLLELLSDAGGIAIFGPSGIGKTHHARHLALELAGRGQLVVWLRASEYEKGRFWPLLARATAPFSPATASELVAAAGKSAAGITVIVDGVNECPPSGRGELIEELGGFVLRHRCSTVLTSTERLTLPEPARLESITLPRPSGVDRKEILAVHGAANAERISDAFSLPFELAIAAECEAALDEHATQSELFDSYVRRLCDSEAVRRG